VHLSDEQKGEASPQPENPAPPKDPGSSQWEITKRLYQLAWPIIGLNVLQVLALAVDTAMVGRTPGADMALTGMGYASQLIFLLMVAMIGLTVGTVAFISRAHGAGHDERVNHILHQSTQLTLMLGLFIAVFGNVIASPLITLLGASDASLGPALDYLRPLLLGTAFNYLNILYAATLRGVGNTRLAFFVSLFMNVLNVVFNYGFILGNYGLPAMGIQGAAIGTVLAQLCAAVLMYNLLHRDAIKGVHPNFGWKPIDWDMARDLARIGWPAATDMVVLNAAFLSIIGMLGAFDERAVAAHGVGLRVQALAFVPGMSISQATGALVGAALGAGHIEEARRVVRASVIFAMVVMCSLALVIVGAAGPLVELFDIPPGTPIYDYSVMWMQLLGYGMPLVGYYISFVGMLQGSGQTRRSLRINLWTTFAFQIPASYILGFTLGMGVWGVWAGFPLSFLIKAVWGTYEYKAEHWAKVGARA